MVGRLDYEVSEEQAYGLIEEHLRYLSSELLGLHLRVQDSLKRMDDMEKPLTNFLSDERSESS